MKLSVLFLFAAADFFAARGFLYGDTQALTQGPLHGVVFPEVAREQILGVDAAGIGDFNGDGIVDIAMGATEFATLFPPDPRKSMVYLIFGRVEFPEVFPLASAAGTVTITADGPNFGANLIGAGDLDGDGLSDIYIHEISKNRTEPPFDPHLYLLYGSRDLPREIVREDIGVSFRGAVLTGKSIPTFTMNGITALRDFNGDGLPDLALGEPRARGPANEGGMLTVLFGARNFQGQLDIDSILKAGGGVRILGSFFSDAVYGFGTTVSSAGDVNGDGLTDMVVSDPKFRGRQSNIVGRAYLIFGSRQFPALSRIDELGDRGITIENRDEREILLVQDVFGGGDLNGDGFSEFGFSFFEPVSIGTTPGRVLILKGGRGLPSRISFSSIQDGTFGFELRHGDPLGQGTFGSRVILAPDEDRDGRPEIFVGSDVTGGEDIVVKGAFPAPPEAVDQPIHTFKAGLNGTTADQIGDIMDTVGDVNADGVPDYIIGAPRIIPWDSRESRVFLLFGGFETDIFRVRTVTPRQAPVGKSIAVTLAGEGFTEGVKVFFGDLPAAKVTVLDPRTLRVTTPVVSTPSTVDLVVLHPDSRRAVLSSGFSFNEVRRLSLGDLDGVVTFRVERGKRIWPEVLGDLDGDGVEEYALRSGDKGDTPGGGGTTYLVHGGTTWSGDIPEDILASHSVHFVTGGNNPPWLLPLGDLNHDGKDDCAVASPYSNYRGAGEFAVVFDTPPIGDEVDFNSLAGDPDAAYFSSTAALGFDVRNAGDFDGDGVEDLVTFSVRTFFSDEPPRIFLIFGPIARGERVDLDASGKVLIISDAKNPDIFGEGLSPVGDFNGDGLPDLAFHSQQAVIILLGHSPDSREADLADLELAGMVLKLPYRQEALFAGLFGKAGDLNGDGFADIFVHGSSPVDKNRGYAGVLLGRKTFSEQATWNTEAGGTGGFFVHGDEDLQFFGQDAVIKGDIDGDRKVDLVVGSFRATELAGGAEPGLVHIIHDIKDLRGEAAVSEVNRSLTVIEGAAPMDRFGQTVRVLGDQDGDGLPELLVEASFALFGTPDSVGTAYLIPGASLFRSKDFKRGDANADGAYDITDAVFTLNWLFVGGPAPECPKGADADDSGRVDISDAIFSLGCKFLGTSCPPPPFPGCGPDLTADELGCDSFPLCP